MSTMTEVAYPKLKFQDSLPFRWLNPTLNWLNKLPKQEETFELDRSEHGRHVSEALYWERYYQHPNFKYEWNNGILEEKPMADYAKSLMYRWFLQLLEQYVQVKPIAKLVILDIGFWLETAGKVSIRKPDLAIILNDNPCDISGAEATYQGIFDLCVESLSDSTQSEIERDTILKKEEYQNAGVREYYILDDRKRYTIFYYRNSSGQYEPLKPVNGVIRSRVLPGFQFRIADLYRQPSLLELAEDEVYQGFVMQEYQAKKKQAEHERQAKEQAQLQAEQAQLQAEQERREKELAQQRLEQLAVKLRELGIDPTSI